MQLSVAASKSKWKWVGSGKWKWVARVTANTGVFDLPWVLEPRANTTLVCHFFKFLQVKTHVSLSAIVSTLGQFRITSSDAAHSQPFWNSETLTRLDISVFQKQVWKVSPGTAQKRMPACLLLKQSTKRHVSRQSLSTISSNHDELPPGEEEAMRPPEAKGT